MSDVKSELFQHLWDHGVLLTTWEYAEMSLEDMRKLDPCEVSDGV